MTMYKKQKLVPTLIIYVHNKQTLINNGFFSIRS